MPDEKRELREAALQLLLQSESDEVDWSEVEQTAVELRLLARVKQLPKMLPEMCHGIEIYR